jgi:predicted site-specific integrase-resolvase
MGSGSSLVHDVGFGLQFQERWGQAFLKILKQEDVQFLEQYDLDLFP